MAVAEGRAQEAVISNRVLRGRTRVRNLTNHLQCTLGEISQSSLCSSFEMTGCIGEISHSSLRSFEMTCCIGEISQSLRSSFEMTWFTFRHRITL